MIKSKLNEAEDAVRAALISALENKKDKHVSKLFNLYNTVRDVNNSIPAFDNVFTINTAGSPYMETTQETVDWLNNYSSAKSSLTFNSNPDIITFS